LGKGTNRAGKSFFDVSYSQCKGKSGQILRLPKLLVKVIYEMGKDIKALKRQDKIELVKITSLSEYKINKYLSFYDYPESVVKKFMESEMKEVPDKGMDPDILSEMYAPIKIIKDELKDFYKKYNEEKIIDACVKKKANGIVKTNRDFRVLTKSLVAMRSGHVRKEVMYDKLESFIKDLEVTPQKIYEETSEALYQVDSIIKKTESLIKEIQNLNLNQITREEKKAIKSNLATLIGIIKSKLR